MIRILYFFLQLTVICDRALFIWRKPVPRRRIILPAKSTLGTFLREIISFAGAKSARVRSDCLTYFDRVDPGRAKVIIQRNFGSAWRVTLPSQNGSPRFERKRMKSWLAQGSSGRQVSLLHWTTFFHIKGPKDNIP